MSFWEKITSAFKSRQQTNKKSANVTYLNTNIATWSNRDFLTYATEGYLFNIVVFRCVQEIAKATSSVDWGIYRKLPNGKREEVHDSALNNILIRPNPDQGWADFILNVVAFLVLDGTTFISRIVPEAGLNKGVALELEVEKPHEVEVKTNDAQEVIGYCLRENGQIVKEWIIDPITRQSDLLKIKQFHPIEDVWGASGTQAAAREIDTSNEAINWHKSLLENQGRPGMIIISEEALGDESYERLEKDINERFSGGHNAGRNLILEGGGKIQVKPYNLTPAELDFVEGSREKARNIASGYGIPAQLIGVIGDSTFSNYKEARQAFYESTVIHYLNLLKTEFNNWLFKDQDIFLDYSLDNVPALAEKRQLEWENAQKADFLTINEKREKVGKEAFPGGDVILVNSNLLPLSDLTFMDDLNEDEEESKTREQLLAEGFSAEEVDEMLNEDD